MPKTQVCCCLQQYPRKTSDGGVISSHSDLIYCDTQGTGNWRDLQNMLSDWIQNVIPFPDKLTSHATKWKILPSYGSSFSWLLYPIPPPYESPHCTSSSYTTLFFFLHVFVLSPLFFSGSLINKQPDHVELPRNIASEIFYPYARWLEPSLTSGLSLCAVFMLSDI